MKRVLSHGWVIAPALAGILGSILGTRALNQAMTTCQNLYRVDNAGSQIESDLEFETQESRRAFLYALATQDPNEQLPYIDQARGASERVKEALRRLRLLRASDMEPRIEQFEHAWGGYGNVRNEIIARVLEGDTAAAMSVERTRGMPAFADALRSLHALKSTLEQRARIASTEVDRTLKRCALGLAAFTASTLLIVVLLSKANLDRRLALQTLHANNVDLAKARKMEEQRATILEMVSKHAPLSRTLTEIAELAPRSSAHSGAAIWAGAGSKLNFQVAANLPMELREMLQHLLPGTEESSEPASALEAHRADLRRQVGLPVSESRVLHDAGGQPIGMLQVFAPDENSGVPTAVLDQMAQLAAVGIDNTLLYERLAFQAQHDTLTGLPNRLLFQDRVQQALQLARRQRKKAALLWIDLDRYKQINDTLGHRVGDDVLCEVGRRLKSCLRGSDLVARVGGDEFTVLAYDIDGAADAEQLCRKLLTAVSQHMVLEQHSFAITASIGFSVFPEHGEDPTVLMRHADLAMYIAKRDGGNTQHLFSPALGHSMQRRRQLEKELTLALERNELTLHYQPLMDQQGRLAGLEALIRWTNVTLGPVPPVDFIPLAEEIGLIQSIGEWVIRTACLAGARWLKAGFDVPNIAVNVSAVQFVAKDFAPTIERVLKVTEFPAARLVIEITETALMNNLEQTLEQMASLRDLGVRFAIDDFGTGYSSLSQLRNLPVDCLKIDRSFIKDLEAAGRGSSTLVSGIIGLAHSLQLEVVAEGIETDEQLTLLRAMGCDINQGFLLYKPMPPDQVEQLLKAARWTDTSAAEEGKALSLLLPSTV